MSPPPGNNGGAVSGAGPCARVVEAPSNTTNNSDAHSPRPSRNIFRSLTASPPAKMGFPARTCTESRGEPTGGQTRCGEAWRLVSKELAERGIALQSCGQKIPGYLIPQRVAQFRERRVKTKCLAETMADRKQRASRAWSCNTPDHDDRDDRVKRTALNCSTASPVLASSRRRNRTHRSRQRRLVQPKELV